MADDPSSQPPLYSQIDVAHNEYSAKTPARGGAGGEVAALLRELLAAQDRQNELLEELVNQLSATQRQRAAAGEIPGDAEPSAEE